MFSKLGLIFDERELAEYKGEWPKYFHAALWADRITVRRTTGFSPYYLMFGTQCLVPVEFDAESWHAIDWKYPMTCEELIAARTKQLARKEENLEIARKKF